MSQLPQELYGEIISHIPGLRDIISVSFTSRSIHREAEPFLWRNITIDQDHVLERLTHLATPRVAWHIQYLRVVIRGVSILDLLRTTLQAASNLKSLDLLYKSTGTNLISLNLECLVQDTTFKLQRLLCYLPVSLSCREFFRQQTQLIDMEISFEVPCAPTNFFSPTDLPSLTILSVTMYGCNCVEALLSGRKITHLSCSEAEIALTRPAETIVTLEIGHYARFTSNVWDIFPNLRSISFRYQNKIEITEIVKNVPSLRHAKMFAVRGVTDYSSSALFARELYQYNPRLEGVEIALHYHYEGGFSRWRFDRDCDLNTPASPLMGLVGRDDWRYW